MSRAGCAEIRKRIQDYVEGALTDSERDGVDAHLSGCDACERELAATRSLVSLLAAAPARKVRSDFEASVLGAVAETRRETPATAAWQRLRLRFEWRVRMPALVAAGSLAATLVAAVSVSHLAAYREHQQERVRYVASAVERHQELDRDNPAVDWDAVEASVELSAGGVLTE